MKQMNSIKRMTLTAVCVALCVVLPIAFHSIPNAGSVFLPMHIPVLICGLICGWPYGLLCGLLGPFLSSFTGMPPMSVLPGMMVECAVYGAAAGLMMRFVRTGKLYVDLYICLPVAMLAGRVISGLVKAWILTPGGVSMAAWATASFVTGLPGILIQLVLIPPILGALMRAHMIPQRYSKGA